MLDHPLDELTVSTTDPGAASAGTTEDRTLVVLELFWQRRGLMGRIMVGALLLFTLIAFVIPKRYTSTTRIMPSDAAQSGAAGAAMMAAMTGRTNPGLAGFASELLGVRSSGALFVALLQGRTIQDRLVQRFDLRKVYGVRYWEDARNDLRKHTIISEDRKSGIITVRVTDTDPHRAAEMAKAYVEELDRLVAQVSTSSARQERKFIEQRLQSVKVDLDRAQNDFSKFASKNTALDIKEQTKAMVASAAELQGQLIAAQSQLQGLEQIYTANNVRVRSLRARVAELQRQLAKLRGTDATLDGKEEVELYPPLRKLPLLGVEWADLYRDARVQETVYELLTQQYELARIQEAKETPVVRVTDAADVPEKRSFPPRLLIIVIGTLFSTVTAALLLVGTNWWQTLTPKDPRKILVSQVVEQMDTKLHLLRISLHRRSQSLKLR